MKKPDCNKIITTMAADKALIDAYFDNPTPENKAAIAHIKFVKPFKLKDDE